MSPRGGPRPGSGRPRTGAKPSLTVRMPAALLAQVRTEAEEAELSISAWLERVVSAALTTRLEH